MHIINSKNLGFSALWFYLENIMAIQDNIDIQVDINPSKTDDELIRNELHAFNVNAIGKEEHYSIFAYNASQKIIGGALIYAEKHSIFIDNLWVHKLYRSKGIGSKLISAAEQEAIVRKIPYSTTDTFTFQAVDFYLKQGYKKIGVIKNYMEGHDKVYFRKKIVNVNDNSM